ncbi:Hypp8806 [Branchiostoma lanceolatum]|uniref:Hypp8806 protein n=1 Tax=Branchiostoma lanceolatum TaxID=7740 RepID=A0A8J9ZAP6_BRALA|nr:Hypp8806 [Branchiostoma lanceolatum]
MGYRARTAFGLGVTMVILGIVSVAVSLVAMFVPVFKTAVHPHIALGLYSLLATGIVAIISGSFGIASGKTPDNGCRITGFLSTSIVVAILGLFFLVAVAILLIVADGYGACALFGTGGGNDVTTTGDGCIAVNSDTTVNLAVAVVLLVLGVLELVLGAVAATVSCRGLCTGYHGHESPAIVVYSGNKATALQPGQRAVQQPDGTIVIAKTAADQANVGTNGKQ